MDIALTVLPTGVVVASFAYLAWVLFAVWRGRGWLPPQNEGRPDDQFARVQEAGFETYGSEDCYKYCKEHPGRGDADAWLPCERACRI
jgi:hypothetical protein